MNENTTLPRIIKKPRTQIGPYDCVLTSTSNSLGWSDEKDLAARMAVTGLNRPLSPAEAIPILQSEGVFAGFVLSQSVQLVSDDIDQDLEPVSVPRELVNALRVLAARENVGVDQYATKQLKGHVSALDLGRRNDLRKENGLVLPEKKPTPREVVVRCSLWDPALVFVNTGEGQELGHCCYWSGKYLYDPAKEAPSDDLSEYSINMWIPLVKMPPPKMDTVDFWIKMKEILKQKEQNKEQNPELVFCKVRMIRNCLVTDLDGSVKSRGTGEIIVVEGDVVDDLQCGRRPSCEVLKVSSSLEDLQ